MRVSNETNRLVTFFDAALAIIVTVMILEVKVPTGEDYKHDLMHLIPDVLATLASFVTLGAYWLWHRSQFAYVTGLNRAVVWLNFAFLAVSGFVPFATGLLMRHPFDRTPILIYGAVLTTAGFLLSVHWYVAVRCDLVTSTRAHSKALMLTGLVGPCIYLIATLLALLVPVASLVLFVATPILYVLPARHSTSR